MATHTPHITSIEVIPVAGRDGMLMNLSGAHGPYFTRNVLLIHDSAGRTGVGEVPGGEGIRQALEDSQSVLVGQSIGQHLQLLEKQLARANSMVLTNSQQTAEETNELTAGLKADDADAEWKKKVIYD